MFSTGYTLIEIIIVIALTSFIGVFTVAINLQSLIRSEVVNERDSFIALVALRARSAELNNYNQLNQGIFIDSNKRRYTLFQGSKYYADNVDNITIAFSTSNISVVSTNSQTIIFERLSGNSLTGSQIIRFNDDEITQTVSINEVGQVNW